MLEHMKIASKTLNNWLQRTVILERKWTSEMSPKIAPDDTLPRGEQNLLLHRQYQGEVSLGCLEANPIWFMRTDIRISFKSYLKTLD